MITALRGLRVAISRQGGAICSQEGASLVSNSSWSLITQLARVASLALVLIVLSRHFGPQRFGSLAFGLAFVRVFAVLASFGLDRILVQHLVEAPEQRDAIVQKGFFLKLATALGTYVVMMAIAFAISLEDPLVLQIIALAGTALLFQCCDAFDFAFQAQNRFRTVFLGRAVPIIAFAGLKVAAVLFDAPLLAFAALEAMEAMAIAIALFCFYRARQRKHAPAGMRPIGRRDLLARGFPILIASLSVMIYMRSDILLLGKLAGYGAAGVYSAAAQVTEACALLPVSFVPALFPLLVRWRTRGSAFYHDQLQKLFLGAAMLGWGVTLILTATAPLLIRALYGAEYSAAAGILMIHTWSGLFIYVAAMQSGYDILEGLSWLTALRTSLGAILNVVLNIALIPRYGGAGSAFATVMSQFVAGMLLNLVHPRTRVIFLMQIKALLLLPLLPALVSPERDNAAPAPAGR